VLVQQRLAPGAQHGVQREMGGHRRAAGVVPAAGDAIAVAFLVGMAGGRAAAAQADARRADDAARQFRRQESGEPAGAGAQRQHPSHAAVHGGDRLFQSHHFRQRQFGAAAGARRQHPEPAAPVQQRLLDRMKEAGGVGQPCVALDTARVARAQGRGGWQCHAEPMAVAKSGIFSSFG
jgi:hypothetical protein